MANVKQKSRPFLSSECDKSRLDEFLDKNPKIHPGFDGSQMRQSAGAV
jgi:hypothetical protein